MGEFIAHSENDHGRVHDLKEHLEGVYGFMKQFCIKNDYIEIFRVTALFHDLGKFQIEFQKYLKEGGARGSVPHASLGASLCAKLNHIEGAFAVDGHHKGLPDLGELKTAIAPYREGVILKHITEEWEKIFNSKRCRKTTYIENNFKWCEYISIGGGTICTPPLRIKKVYIQEFPGV